MNLSLHDHRTLLENFQQRHFPNKTLLTGNSISVATKTVPLVPSKPHLPKDLALNLQQFSSESGSSYFTIIFNKIHNQCLKTLSPTGRLGNPDNKSQQELPPADGKQS